MNNLPQSPPCEDTELVLEEIFRHATVGVVLTDMFGTVIDTNAALCVMLGYDRTELIGRNFADFSHPDDLADVIGRMDDLRLGRTGNYTVNRRYLRSTGEGMQARVSISIVYSKTGEPVCGLGIIENITERAAMEEALRQSEMRYRRVVEDQTELITRCLPDGTLTFANSAYCRYNNAIAGALLGTSLFACMDEPEQQLVRAKFAALSPSNAVITDQHWVLDPGGVKRWHEWSDRGFFDEDGTLVGIQSVGRDLTEQHEAQQRLVASEERHRRLFNMLPVAVWENDWSEVMAEVARRGLASPEKFAAAVAADPSIHYLLGTLVRVTAVNPAALAMAGVATTEEFAEWLAHAATLESAMRWAQNVTALMFGDSSFIMDEYTLVRANGESIDVMVRVARSEHWGEEWMTYPIAFDVTGRKRIERQLLHKQELTERAEAAAHLGSWEWSRNGNTFYGSDEFWRIVDGGDGAVERGKTAAAERFASLHPEDLARVNALWTALLAPSRGVRPFVVEHEYRFPRSDGSVNLAVGQIFPTYDDDGSMIRAFGILRDVTEAKRAEEEAARHREELLRADRMIALGILVSGIAHEINNPNHAIALNVPLVRDAWRDVAAPLDEMAAARPDLRIGRLPWPEARAEVTAMLDDVEHASERIRYIVGELRSFALDHDPGDRREASINDIVTASMRLLGKHIARATRHFEMTLGDGIPPVSGNAQRLEQVVVNLVINACQALRDEEQAIRLTTGFDGQRVFIRVQDEGCGIAAEHLAKVRTPFFTTKRGEGGTGLGVAVSDRIAAEHGGELTFESEVGRGTTATLWLPPARR